MIPRRKNNALNSYVYYTSQVNRYFTPIRNPGHDHLPIVDILQEKENTWYVGVDGTAYNLNQGGKIGINTMTPQYTLDVNGKIHVSEDLILSGSLISPLGVSVNVPTGSIMAYVGSIQYGSFGQDPNGWMVCDGRQLPPNGIYKALFDMIGYTFGYGDTFPDPSGGTYQKYLLPDYRGAFLRGSGDNTQNQQYSTGYNYYGPIMNHYQDSSVEAHGHVYTDAYLSISNGGSTQSDIAYANGTGTAVSIQRGQFSGVRTDSTNPNQPRNPDQDHFTVNETRPYCWGINWIIKL